MRRETLSEDERDILREVSNIAAGHSATALSTLVGKTIDINVPTVKLIPVDQLSDFFENPDEAIAVIVCTINEAPRALLALVLHRPTILMLLKTLLGTDVSSLRDLSSIDESALKEIGNILTGAYVTALSETIGQRVTHSIPGIGLGKNRLILESIAGLMKDFVPYVVVFTQFWDKQKEFKLGFLTVANMETVDFIFAKMGTE